MAIDTAIILGFAFLSLVAVAVTPNELKIEIPGDRTYNTYCSGCHEGDNIKIDYNKSDEELLSSIINGSGDMPAYGWLLDSENSLRVLEYMKKESK